jgi:3-oxoacyl-[acyl-carrier-protein] synthase-3
MPVLKFTNINLAKIAVVVPSTPEKTDLSKRVALDEQTTSDLAFIGAQQILQSTEIPKEEIGGIVFCSTTPDYRSPATACVLQGRLGLTKDCLAFDMNIGGVGFSYGLQTAYALLKSINKSYLLLIVGDTTSKQLNGDNPNEQFSFGDAASVVLLKKTDSDSHEISISTGTKSDQYKTFFIEGGGFRGTNGLTNYIKDELVIQTEPFVNAGVQLTIDKVLHFLSDQNKSLDNYDAVILPPLGHEYITSVIDRLSQDGKVKLIPSVHEGNCRGASVLLSIGSLLHKDSERVKNLDIMAIELGEGISWGITSFNLDKNAMLPIIETDYKFQEGKIAREI